MWMINITRMIYLISTVILFVEEFNGQIISINKDPTGQEGSNGTHIECLINMDGVRSVREVSVYAFIKKTNTAILIFYDYGDIIFTPAGEYLRDRVKYTIISERSNRTELRFSRLLCEDDTEYQCQLQYVPDPTGPGVMAVSEFSHLTVTVLPSRPSNITVIKNNGTFDGIISKEQELGNLTFVEGDSITVTCTGEVGKPPTNLTMEKIHRNGTAYTLTPGNLVNKEIPNCSFIQRFTFTTTLGGDDDGSLIRCAVEDTSDKFIETSPLSILYPVRIPDVTISPKPPTRPPVMLHCQGRGNPDPDYTWFKLTNDSLKWEQFSNNQSITLDNLTDSGVYLCEVKNTIGQRSYIKSKNITVTFKASSTPDKSADKDNQIVLLFTVILGIFCGVVVLFFVPYKIITRNKKLNQDPEGTNHQYLDLMDNYNKSSAVQGNVDENGEEKQEAKFADGSFKPIADIARDCKDTRKSSHNGAIDMMSSTEHDKETENLNDINQAEPKRPDEHDNKTESSHALEHTPCTALKYENGTYKE